MPDPVTKLPVRLLSYQIQSPHPLLSPVILVLVICVVLCGFLVLLIAVLTFSPPALEPVPFSCLYLEYLLFVVNDNESGMCVFKQKFYINIKCLYKTDLGFGLHLSQLYLKTYHKSL